MNDLIAKTLILGGIICAFAGTAALVSGLFLSTQRKYIAGRLMEFGRICILLMCSIFALMVIQFGHYWQGILIFAAIISGAALKNSKINRCPDCGEFIELGRQWTHFTKWVFLRKSSFCNNCKTRLIRAKLPWYLTQVGFVLMIAYFVFRLSGIMPSAELRVMLYSALMISVAGIFTGKFEREDRRVSDGLEQQE